MGKVRSGRQVARTGGGVALRPQSYGMQPHIANAQAGRAVADVLGQTAALVGKYAEKHKRQDMAADEAAYSSFTTKRLADAKSQATLSSDPKEVARIYKGAESDIAKWVTGKNEGGTPNVRWKDHQMHVQNQFEGIRAGIHGEVTQRKLDIYRADTKTKLEDQIQTGIETGNMKTIGQSVDLLHQDGFVTREQAAVMKKERYRDAEKYRANQVIRDIESSTPEDAEAKLNGFTKAISDQEQYKHLDEATRKELQSHAKRGLWGSQRAADDARRERAGASADELTAYMVENGGNVPSIAELDLMNLTDEHKIKVMKANRPIQQRELAVEVFGDLQGRIAQYSRNNENSSEERMEVSIALAQLPADLKAPLAAVWKLKTTPGKEVQAVGLERVIKFVDDLKPWKVGDGYASKDEKVLALATEQAAFQSWVEQERPSDDAIINYVRDNPRYKALRSSKDVGAFKRSLNAPTIKAVPTVGGVQGVYLTDEEINEFEGL